MNITKAEKVKQEYYDAIYENEDNGGCYQRAVNTAVSLGGIVISGNNNYGDIVKSFASDVVFEFDDSTVQITWHGVFL